MRELWLVGIGTGNPDHVTLEGQHALRDAATILLPRKGRGKEDLAHIRRTILQAASSKAEIASFDMPSRDESLPYEERVEQWHDEIARRWTDALLDAPSGPVALLVWGDPGFYDSTLRIAARLNPVPQIRVIPGVTAMQALTAAHRIPFNEVNGDVTVTTGRKLRESGWPDGARTLCVVLDGQCSFQTLDMRSVHIWWGAFLGMPEQILDSGHLPDVCERIVRSRAEARDRHGWIMDTYILRRV